MRQGPSPPPSAGVQFRPTSVKAPSRIGVTKAISDHSSDHKAGDQRAWRYILVVERVGRSGSRMEEEDERIDTAWLEGTARSRGPLGRPSSQLSSPLKKLDRSPVLLAGG